MLRIPRPLVSTSWLSKALAGTASPSLRLLDASWTPAGNPTGSEIYQEGHIAGSRFFDLEECRDKGSPYRVMLPSPEAFGDYVGSMLGIGNDSDVVVYDNDPKYGVKSSGRVWWMFRVFGHDRVTVLDGGLRQWVQDGHPVTTEIPATAGPVRFESRMREELVKKFEDILENQKEAKFQLLDSRPRHWFDGSQPNPSPGLPLGTIKGSSSLPFAELFQEGSSKLKSPEEIRSVFRSKGIDLSKPLTTLCKIGITSNMLNLGAFAAGREDVAGYDGSWLEFCQRAPEDAMDLNTNEQ